MMFRHSVLALVAVGPLLAAPVAHAQQTLTVPPQPGILVGQAEVTGPSWTFSDNLPSASGPWDMVTVTNTNCSRPYLPGTAQAGAVIFTATLGPGPRSNGTLHAFVGSQASGNVQLLPMADTGGTNVTTSLDALEPFAEATTLSVCLTQGPQPPILADINVGQQRVAATNFDVTGVATASSDAGQPLIAISGSQTTFSGTNRQFVFFFVGDTYLGTDTSIPSLAPLQLVGSPGDNQIGVSYDDPSGGGPVIITYRLSAGSLAPDGTPPGH
jgi:hypothetical protein